VFGKQFFGVATEARTAGIGVGQSIKAALGIIVLVEGFLEDHTHSPVLNIVEAQRPLAGRFQSYGTITLAQTNHTLRRPQAVEDAVRKQSLYKPMAARSGRLGLF